MKLLNKEKKVLKELTEGLRDNDGPHPQYVWERINRLHKVSAVLADLTDRYQ
jgi:hypothetical protein